MSVPTYILICLSFVEDDYLQLFIYHICRVNLSLSLYALLNTLEADLSLPTLPSLLYVFYSGGGLLYIYQLFFVSFINDLNRISSSSNSCFVNDISRFYFSTIPSDRKSKRKSWERLFNDFDWHHRCRYLTETVLINTPSTNLAFQTPWSPCQFDKSACRVTSDLELEDESRVTDLMPRDTPLKPEGEGREDTISGCPGLVARTG